MSISFPWIYDILITVFTNLLFCVRHCPFCFEVTGWITGDAEQTFKPKIIWPCQFSFSSSIQGALRLKRKDWKWLSECVICGILPVQQRHRLRPCLTLKSFEVVCVLTPDLLNTSFLFFYFFPPPFSKYRGHKCLDSVSVTKLNQAQTGLASLLFFTTNFFPR